MIGAHLGIQEHFQQDLEGPSSSSVHRQDIYELPLAFSFFWGDPHLCNKLQSSYFFFFLAAIKLGSVI